MSEGTRFQFTTDFQGGIPSFYGSDYTAPPNTFHVNLGDFPGSKKFNAFKKAYYDIFNLLREYADNIDGVPQELQSRLHPLFEVWKDLNFKNGSPVNLCGMELAKKLMQDANGVPYPHFGAYRKTFPVSLQKTLFADTVGLMNRMADFYKNAGFYGSLAIEGNVDKGYFGLYDSSITDGATTRSIMEGSFDYFNTSVFVKIANDFSLVTVPFYCAADNGKSDDWSNTINVLRNHRSDGPLILAMHGAPTHMAHQEKPFKDDQLAHAEGVAQIIAALGSKIDLIVYGNLLAPIEDTEITDGLYGLGIYDTIVPTKYLKKHEVFEFTLDDLPALKEAAKNKVFLLPLPAN
ncbi:MAG: hypothetical protein LBG64_01230 [Pseudomonadales bacterium]|nr:hypothetical protein [Pseudomonadales bacterium]